MTTAGVNDQGRTCLAARVGLELAVFLLAAQPLAAWAQRDEAEVDRARAEFRELLQRARELVEAGKGAEAQELTKKAQDIKANLGREPGRWRRGRPEDGRPEEILDGLRRGMAALHALGRHEEAEKLEAVARNFQREHAGRSQRRHRPGQGRGENKERRVARRQLEIMRMAVEGLAETERRDGADLLQHAIHARKLALEGRRGEDAQHVRRTAPSRQQQAALLKRAAGALRELGRKEQAGAVAELAGSMAQKRQRQGLRTAEHLEAVMHRIAQLEERLAGMDRTIERLADQLHGARAEDDDDDDD